MIRACVSGLTLLLILSAGLPVEARGRTAAQRVGVVPLSSDGEGAAQVAVGVLRVMVKGLRSKHREVKVLENAAKLHLCLQQASCVRAIGTRYQLAVVITGHLEAQGKAFQLDLRAISGRSGEVVASEAYRLPSARDEGAGLRLARKLLAEARASSGKTTAAAPEVEEEPPTPGQAEAAASLDKGDVEDPLAAKQEASKKAAAGARRPADAEQPTPPPPPVSFGRRFWPGFATGAAGLAAIGVGVAFGVVSKQSVDQGRDSKSQVEAADLLDKARQNAMVANILFGAGAAVLTVSAVLFFFEARAARAESRRAQAFHLEFGLAAEGAGICARGEF